MGIIKERLQQSGIGLTENILFDEAWHAYARFNPIYTDRYATCYPQKNPAYKLIFATQSTHKLLAAFSQASMIHIMDQTGEFSHDRFKQRMTPAGAYQELVAAHVKPVIKTKDQGAIV